MRIPHIHNYHLEPVKQESAEVEVDIRPEAYLDDLGLFDNQKEYVKFVLREKKMIRDSYEYIELISFLKRKCALDHCGVHPNLTIYNGFRIELHHTPFCLEDIVHIVNNKRLQRGESLKMGDICREIMELHYLGLVGLYPLCPICHGYAHPVGEQGEDDLFIPMADVYGEPEQFWDIYKQYATDSLRSKFENIRILNKGYNMIRTNIPKELQRKYIYVKPKNEDGKESKFEVVSTSKLVTFIKDLNAS